MNGGPSDDKPWRAVRIAGRRRSAAYYIAAAVGITIVASIVVAGALHNILFEEETNAILWTALGLSAVWGAVVIARLVTRAVDAHLAGDVSGHVFGAMPEPYLITDLQGRSVVTNAAFEDMFGPYTGLPYAAMAAQLCHDEESTRHFARLRAAVQGGRSAQAEIGVATPANGAGWRSVRVHPIPDRPGYAVWHIEDITARHEMEQIIREEQAKLTDYLESAPVGFFSLDAEGRFRFVNATLAQWFGCSVEQLLGGMRLVDFLVGGPHEGMPAHDPAAASLQHAGAEVTLRGAQDRIFHAVITQSVVGEGEGLRTRSVLRDLTPELEWQRALRHSEQRFRRFFEHAPVGIALLDLDGRITETNSIMADALGQPREALPATQLIDLLTGEDRAETRAYLAAVAGGMERPRPQEVRLKGEREIVASLYASRLEDENGAVSGLLVHFLDTTEHKNLERQFVQSQKMQAVGQLAGGIAHDFNNLLTAMIGFCDLLLIRHRPGDQSFADIMQIKQNANRASNLVRQLLAFSRQQTLQPRVLSITDTLAELSNLLRRLIGENLELDLIHGRDIGLVRVDQGQLEQVIINLAVNARDAMPAGGKLTIRTGNRTTAEPLRLGADTVPPGDYVEIEVTDTGTGIPRKNMERIFEPFFSTKEVGAGTGLGLATVYGILKQTGGFIGVESELGAGTIFTIFLPRNAGGETADSAVAAAESRPADLTGTGTILLVEDEDAVRLFSARALRNKGYKVLEARTGVNAVELLRGTEESIDVLITDMMMPQMDGPTLIQHVRTQRPEMRVICISGYAEDSLRTRLAGDTSVHFLPKPFSLNQLAGKVKEVMLETVV